MNFKEYVPLAVRTVNKDLTTKELLLNACLGLVGEYVEYLDSENIEEKREELGDVYWYVAVLKDNIVDKVNIPTPEKKKPMRVIGDICDIVKKHVFQGHSLDVKVINSKVIQLLVGLKEEAKLLGTTQEKLMEANIEKLKARYPKGFEVDKSVNRVN